ncbi:response regulator [Paraburkholderia sp. BL9I2N2]|uniref:response regulator n=1 Tax=Paraburkholderia sp. BL9I2N2 TaxID=1938809 RepID=UPI0032613F38
MRSVGWPTLVFESAEAFLQSAQIDETACRISDVRISGRSGVEMDDHLLQLGRPPPTIFITAFPTAALQLHIDAGLVATWLENPADATAIAHWLAAAANRQRRGGCVRPYHRAIAVPPFPGQGCPGQAISNPVEHERKL